jgi:hypothetical protein
MSHHEFGITLTGGEPRHAIPPATMIVDQGDTVQFFSNDGVARVEFEISPFSDVADDVINDRIRRQVIKRGAFFAKCFVTPTGEKNEIGWSEFEEPQSGGEVIIKP